MHFYYPDFTCKERNKLREVTYLLQTFTDQSLDPDHLTPRAFTLNHYPECPSKFGTGMYALLFLKWITNKDLPYGTWYSAQCYMADYREGIWGKNGYIRLYALFSGIKNMPAMRETQVQSLGWEDPLDEGMAGYPLQYSCLENSTDKGA